MTAPSLAKENQERAEVMRSDQKAREQQQAPTMLDHARAAAFDELGGRFANARGNQQIVGVDGPPCYPQLPSGPWSGSDPVPDEAPLGFAIDQMTPVGEAHEVAASISPATVFPLTVALGSASADAPSPNPLGDVQRSDAEPSSSIDEGQAHD
jgi:hypothetical protein